MGQVEIFQGHVADVIIVGDFHIVVVSLAVRPGLRPVAHLHHHSLGEGVLPVK